MYMGKTRIAVRNGGEDFTLTAISDNFKVQKTVKKETEQNA